jgi:fructan beta-fructosidase
MIKNKAYFFLLLLASCMPEKKKTEQASYYSEQYRPQFHFSPVKNWMNDPNGMVYYEGEYHLFYQHFPDSNVWGPMHWGHAVSKNLIQWEHLPIALYPDSLGLIFSGSAVIDYENTTGFGSLEDPPMIAIFTQHLMEGEKSGRHDFQTQGIAYSLDKGRTWKMYNKNPVIKNAESKHDFRDPKVFWYDGSKQWIMILAVKDHVELYGSPDLKNWNHLSDFGIDFGEHGGVWECPDLFELPIEGSENKKWVMLVSMNPGAANGGSGTQYFTGQFDGEKFISNSKESQWLDYGKDNYAGVTWSNVKDGRRLFLGWMSNWQYATVVPTTAWRSAMTISRVLTLKETELGLRIASNPIEELQKLRKDTIERTSFLTSSKTESEVLRLDSGGVEIELDILRDRPQNEFEIMISNSQGEWIGIGADAQNQFYIDRTHIRSDFSKDFNGLHIGKRSTNSNTIQIKLFIDASSVELFADGGTLAMTELFFPQEPFTLLKLKSKGGITVNSIKTHRLKSIWLK